MYAGKTTTALRQLNVARRSNKWRHLAAKLIVLLCLSQNAAFAVVETSSARGSDDA